MKKRTSSLLILCALVFFGCNKGTKTLEKTKAEDKYVEMFLVNNKKQKTLTSEMIDKTSDEYLEQIISDNILEWISVDYNNELLRVKSLSKGQQMFWSTWKLEGEVNNGGFNQFYFNSDEEFGQMAEDGFQIIGLKQYADLTHEANQIYKENKVRLQQYEDGTVKSFSESYEDNPLNKVDDKFYDLQEKQGISEFRIKYIRKHKEQFTKLD
ncbi:DMP19 family protein [Flavobacterium anhuiense]|mgnify:FL=1|uniref:DMP19 family protein n=1 Tax=Flavobacterium anhuiense TaxID=459526 RepID=UPI003D99C803